MKGLNVNTFFYKSPSDFPEFFRLLSVFGNSITRLIRNSKELSGVTELAFLMDATIYLRRSGGDRESIFAADNEEQLSDCESKKFE
jgi:hypothetical protein